MLGNDLVQLSKTQERAEYFWSYPYQVILYPTENDNDNCPTSFSLGAMWEEYIGVEGNKKKLQPPRWRYMARDGSILLNHTEPKRLELFFNDWCSLAFFLYHVLNDELYPDHTFTASFREFNAFLQEAS